MLFNPSTADVRRFFCDAWQRARQGLPCEPLQSIAAQWCLEHPEYHRLLDASEQAIDKDFHPDAGRENPFLHLSLHLALARKVPEWPGSRFYRWPAPKASRRSVTQRGYAIKARFGDADFPPASAQTSPGAWPDSCCAFLPCLRSGNRCLDNGARSRQRGCISGRTGGLGFGFRRTARRTAHGIAHGIALHIATPSANPTTLHIATPIATHIATHVAPFKLSAKAQATLLKSHTRLLRIRAGP
ncbi:MAG: DUF1841 family protein [Betaproteobacteria bacterium]|nr:DUF1841 family protein [Betaproteobacteria bacterium]